MYIIFSSVYLLFLLFALRVYLQSQLNTERNQTPTTSSHIISYPVMSETSSTKSGPTRKYQNTGTGRSTSRGTGKVSRAVAELEARTRGHLEQATRQLQSTTLASATVSDNVTSDTLDPLAFPTLHHSNTDPLLWGL